MRRFKISLRVRGLRRRGPLSRVGDGARSVASFTGYGVHYFARGMEDIKTRTFGRCIMVDGLLASATPSIKGFGLQEPDLLNKRVWAEDMEELKMRKWPVAK